LLWVGGLCVLALGVWIGFRLYTGIVIEDAWITYRYARNLALGNGFVYNLGEHVLGTTSPLFTMLLAVLGKVFGVGHLEIISNCLMLPAGVAAGVLSYLLLKRFGTPKWLPTFFLAVFFMNFDSLWSMTGGLETPLVILLMAASAYALVLRKPVWAAVWAALLVLTRIDGMIWSGAIFLLIFLEHRRALWKSLLVGLLIVGPWLAFATFYFGSPIPNTVAAKSTIGLFEDYSPGMAITSYLGWGLLYLSRISPFGRLIGWFLFLFGGWTIFKTRRYPVLKLLVIFPFAFLFAYYVGHAPKFPWYLIPLTWAGMVVGVIGLWETGKLVFDLSPERWRHVRVVHWALVACLATFAMALFTRDLATTRFHHDWMLEESHVRKPLGLWLRDHSAPDATIAMEAIGYQGYFSERRVIDFAGLISPEVVELYRKTGSDAQVFYSIVTTSKPDFVVLREFEVAFNQCFLGGPLFEDGDQRIYFTDNYREAAHFQPYNRETGRGLFDLVVYQRITNETPDIP
jgi:hypothetical protein